jgi:RNA polymerase sigma-70 factor (TIGR02957 family)
VTDLAVAHDDLRPLMFSVAYRMLGSVSEAEDIVQEAFLRLHVQASEGTTFASPEAYATTVTTRLAIDALRSARRTREQYVGSWLPEPLLADDDDPAHRVERDETVSLAFLELLERLGPVERAVFVLRELFAFDYTEIAATVGRSEASCRQALVRARRRLDDGPPARGEVSPERQAELATQFFAAVRDGDVAGLQQLLAEDVVFVGDGGGRAAALAEPLAGLVRVARFVLGIARQATRLGVRVEEVRANGGPAARWVLPDGRVYGVLSLEIGPAGIERVNNLINPDKLHHAGRVVDPALPGQS